jgi:hypothetical protein
MMEEYQSIMKNDVWEIFLPNVSTKQGPAKTMNTPSKDLNSNAS